MNMWKKFSHTFKSIWSPVLIVFLLCATGILIVELPLSHSNSKTILESIHNKN